ncbi:MAG: hypothetical protein EOM10_18220, partial [Opitutae bacterium]|nr:hypothetical protein [Opitutae bacterium]
TMVRFGNRSLSLYKAVAIIADMVMVFFALALALALRFDFAVPAAQVDHFMNIWPMYVGFNALLYFTIGFYDQIWRFASVSQYALLFFGTLVQPGFLGLVAALRLTSQPQFPRSVYIIYWLLSFLLIVGLRIAYRVLSNRTALPELVKSRLGLIHMLASHTTGQTGSAATQAIQPGLSTAKDHAPYAATPPAPPRRVMIIGAGAAGNQLIRELQHNRQGRTPVVIIDDNRQKHTYRVLGVPVYGDRHAIPAAAEKYQVQEIILAIPSAPRQEIREIVEIASRTGCELKIIPALYELIDGQVSLKDIKEVEIEDLLGRDEIVLDTAAIAGYLRGETVLVT